MSAYTQDLEAGLARLWAEIKAAKNDTRLADGAYAMANTNIALLKGSLAKLQTEAVKRGHAEWVVGVDGGTTFRWKEER